MKHKKILFYSILMLIFYQTISAQTINWKSLEKSKHIIHLGTGWDYSLSASLGYAYKFNTKRPLILGVTFSVPFGEVYLDDFKSKVGGQIVVLNNNNFKGILTLNGIYRRYESPLVRLNNFGSEVKGNFGYYKLKWFLAAEMGFDKAIVTHFKHSDIFKENIYKTVKDGWYQPATGGNFNFGVQTGYSFKKADLTINVGLITTEDFKNSPAIPYYLMLGYNCRIF